MKIPGALVTKISPLASKNQILNGFKTRFRVLALSTGHFTIFDIEKQDYLPLSEWRETETNEEEAQTDHQICENSEISRIIKDKDESEKITKADLELF